MEWMIPKNFLKISKLPIIGIGPMSKNCVDASIEFSNENNFLLMLIASRRQIESNELGRGYVNNWSTEEFSTYVLKKDKKKKIILCRDHGGPWQNDRDKKQKLSLKNAMNSAKKSFKADIDDSRSSLSYKLKKMLMINAKNVITTDPYVKDDKEIKSLDETIKNSDILILATPHKAYKKIKTKKPLIDIWNIIKK